MFAQSRRFNVTLSQIRVSDQHLSAVAPNVQFRIPKALTSTPCEATATVLSSLVGGLEPLKDGILDLAETGNLYAVNALLRIFLEHTLKALGIFQRATEEMSDDFANAYLKSILKEAADYKKALTAAGLTLDEPEQFILHPWFEEAGKLKAGELDDLARPFQYKKLIEAINTSYGFTKPNFLSMIVPNFAELSGFVHGGPSTQLIMDAHAHPDAKAARLEQVAGLVVAMFCSAKRWLLMLAGMFRPEFTAAEQDLSAAMAKYL